MNYVPESLVAIVATNPDIIKFFPSQITYAERRSIIRAVLHDAVDKLVEVNTLKPK